ncbi:hypothetical protein ACIQMV_13390, partial [Streptomyces sp. NPDC091412]|uniref:hypothetical protein n=1 Tax=Streptomyces sp. NPDC091412 TaxID=3366002 RepID=UPI00380243BA
LGGGASSILGEVAKYQKSGRRTVSFATQLGLGGEASSILGEVRSLIDLSNSAPPKYASNAFQLAKLAAGASPFAGGFDPLSSVETLSAAPVISSALKLSDLYRGRLSFSDPVIQVSVESASVVDPDSIDIAAQNLLANEEAASELTKLVETFVKQADEAEGGPASRFSPKNIAPGALLLGVLVFLFGTAADVIGAFNPSLSNSLDRQFMYVSFGMATVYFWYQEGKR